MGSFKRLKKGIAVTDAFLEYFKWIWTQIKKNDLIKEVNFITSHWNLEIATKKNDIEILGELINRYIDKLGDIVKKQNIYHRTIKMKPVDVKSKAYINFNKKKNYEDPKFNVGDYVRKSKYKMIKTFVQKYMFQIGLKRFLLLKKLKILCRGNI